MQPPQWVISEYSNFKYQLKYNLNVSLIIQRNSHVFFSYFLHFTTFIINDLSLDSELIIKQAEP